MPVYTVSNKQIVISPKRPSSKKYLGAFLIAGLASLIIRSFTSTKTASTENVEMIQEMVTTGAAEKLTLASKDLAVNVAERAISISVETSGIQSWEWFLLGTWFAIVLFMAFALVSERRGKK